MIVLHLSLSENAGVCAEDGPGSELRWEGDAGDSPQATGTCPGSGVSGQGGHPALNSHPGERARMWFVWQNGRMGGVCAMGIGRGVVGGLWAHLKVSCAVCGCPKEKVTGWPLAHCPQMSWLGNNLACGIWLTCGLLLHLVCILPRAKPGFSESGTLLWCSHPGPWRSSAAVKVPKCLPQITPSCLITGLILPVGSRSPVGWWQGHPWAGMPYQVTPRLQVEPC